MKYLASLYRRYVYGVMGTLVFHILLIASFLLADVNIKGSMKEEPIIIEFPDVIPEDEVKLPEEEKQQENLNESINSERLTNAASNRLSNKSNTSTTDKFFDNEYSNEVNEAKKLVSDVKSQLAKEKIKIEDIKMPVETTEGMNPDSIKNVIYTGESNIVYYLENRYHVSLPIPVYLAKGGGKIIVEIVVDRQGRVIQANLKAGQKIADEQMVTYALSAATHTLFNSDPNAPAAQKGTIHYNFVAQ